MEYGVLIELDDQTEEDFEDEEEESEDEDDDDDDDDEEVVIPMEVTSPRVALTSVVCNEGLVAESNDVSSCKGKLESQDEDEELDGTEIDGLFCPICTEAWTSGGEHQICCLPCGHIYGLSCIKKWIRQRSSGGKCPNCNKRCTLKDIRVLYATRLCVVDANLQKKVKSIEAKCASLEQKNVDCRKNEVEARKREADLQLKVDKLTEKTKDLERLLEKRRRESFTSNLGYQRTVIHGSGPGNEAGAGAYTLLREYQVDGGRLFDIDASGQLMIVARRLNGMGGTSLLTKISLVASNEREDIQLPANTKAVRALCVNSSTRRALVASVGKKLSVVSTESNNIVLTYDLPAPAWSCAWDIDSSHHVYAGLQNGMVMGFDMRQTKTPLDTRNGLTSNPVHTLISVAPDSSSSGTRTLLTASQIGICEWNIGGTEERPYLIPESKNDGQICISLAHGCGDDIVASFRPKIEASSPMAVTQLPSTPSMTCGVEGSHVFYKRSGAQTYQKTGSLVAEVDSVRLPKSCIMDKPNSSPMFVAANEGTSDLVLHDVGKVAVVQRVKTRKKQIWDVKCAQIWNSGVIGCLNGDVVQLFTSP